MRFKFIAVILGFLIAIPIAVSAQDSDQAPPPPPVTNVQMPPAPDDQTSMEPGSTGQDANQSGSSNAGSSNPNLSNPSLSNQNSSNPGLSESGAAQSYNTPAPPETNAGVARFSQIHGDVSTQRGDANGWSAAALNAPVLAGDRVSTGDKARTELQLDYANMFRLGERTQANIATLTRSQIQIQLGRGMAYYSVVKNSDADSEIDTPNVAIRTNRREASFRVLVASDDHTEVLVRRGEVEITTPQGGTRVEQGQLITVKGAGDEAQYKISAATPRDDWDQWNTDRDNIIRNADSRRKTNDYYVGAEDLDAYGTWSEVPDYGPVWRPTAQVGWAPYRAGRWVYEPYWGWTWVSYDPWGWAPYHYGRWMYYDSAWVWWPGPAYGYPFYRPIWAPAYVSFFGFGHRGFGFGFGFGSVGWLPLGPCDRFFPWWGGFGGRFEAFRFHEFHRFDRGGFAPLHRGDRFSNVRLAMHDGHFRGGTFVSSGEFGRGNMRAQAMSHATFRNANFSTGRLPVTPGRESFSASGRAAAAATIPSRSQNQHFFSASSASASHSFVRGQSPMAGVNRPGGGMNTSANDGFQRFSQSPGMRGNANGGSMPRSGNSMGSASARASVSGNGGGWQRFSSTPGRSSSGSSRMGGSVIGGSASSNGGSRNMGSGSSGYSRQSPGSRSSYGASRSYGGGYSGGRPAGSYSGG